MKTILSIRTKARKRSTKFEIRKEHITYSDGSTEDRTVAYSFDGVFLGAPKDAEKKLTEILIKQEKKELRRKNK